MNLLREIMDEIKPQIMTKIETDMKREIIDQMRVMLEEPSLMQLTKDVEAKVEDRVREEIVDRIERRVDIDDLVSDIVDNAEVERLAEEHVAEHVRNEINLEDLIKNEISDSDIENNMPNITDQVQSALIELIGQEMSVEKVQAAMRPILRKLVIKELGLNEGAGSASEESTKSVGVNL